MSNRDDIQTLLERAADADGFWPLSDQLMADLDDDARHPDRREEHPIGLMLPGEPPSALAAYAQVTRREGGWTMQVVVDPAGRASIDIHEIVLGALGQVHASGGGRVDWWMYQPGPDADQLAAAHGFRFDRDLLQMRRPLPVGTRAAVTTRSFVVGRDETAWLAVNNRAFAGHAEQGTWTVDTLHQRMAQPWFDAAGFRLHERDGTLAAFCWTKPHDATTGEIYVIAVDPDFQGLGLGKELTLAGLDHLHDHGVTEALLYVDGDNVAARAMYERLGFAVRRTDRAYSLDV